MKTTVSLLAALGLATLMLPPLACSVDEIETELDCFDYCRTAADCNDEVNREECEQECEDTLNDCMADEREQAQDQLDGCAEEACDDFTACTIEAGAQCYFGL